MVRLKESILTAARESIGHFNSNMVRLKGQTDKNHPVYHLHFNSNMVRLKVTFKKTKMALVKYFNSNMVRL